MNVLPINRAAAISTTRHFKIIGDIADNQPIFRILELFNTMNIDVSITASSILCIIAHLHFTFFLVIKSQLHN